MRAPAPHAAHIHPTPQDGRRGSSRHRQRRDRGGGSCRRPDASSGGWGAPCPRPSAPTPLAGAAAGDRRRVGRRASGGAAREPLCEGSCWRVETLPRAPRAERGRGAVSGASCPRPPPPRRPALRRHPAVLACPRARVRCRRPLTAVTNYFFLSLFSFFFPTLFLPSSRPGCAWHARHTASNQLWGPHRGHPRA